MTIVSGIEPTGTTSSPEEIPVAGVLPKSSIQIVETPMVRMLRPLLSDINRVAALVAIILGIIGSLLIIAISDSLRATAFQLFSTIVSAALGFFFGSRDRDNGKSP